MTDVPSIALLPLPNFTLTAFSTLVDVIRLAADEGDRSRPVRFRWSVITPNCAPVQASCGVELRAQEPLRDPGAFDYIVVCGGLLRRRHTDDEAIEDFLRRAWKAGVTIIGVCTGSFMMAQAGLLAGRKACVSWFHLADFNEEFPDVEVSATDLFLADGRCVTCAGGTGSADVGAWIIERHADAALARKALGILQIDGVRPAGALQPRPAIASGAMDERLRRAILMIAEQHDRPVAVHELARAVGVSRRQLLRLFKHETGSSPSVYGAQLRLNHADWLLATSRISITEIALSCGFADAAHFSRRYKTHFGKLPSRARAGRHEFISNEPLPYLTNANA